MAREPEVEEIVAALSTTPVPDKTLISRRAVLGAAAAGIGLSMLPDWLLHTAAMAATPIGPSDGVLVVVYLGGGNDGLNTVVPTGTSTYYARRPDIAIAQNAALPIAPGTGFHPSLAKLKARYDAGKVAVVRGVGYANPDLSHFTSVANWMSGWAPGGPPSTGWLGRYLDGLGKDPLYGVMVGESVPLHLKGATTSAIAVPTGSGQLIGSDLSDPVDSRLAAGMRAFGAASTGSGALTDLVAATVKGGVDIAGQVAPSYVPGLPDGEFVPDLTLCARLINANLGIRVLGASLGSFDTHSGQPWEQDGKLAALDAGIEAFFATLSPTFAGRVTLMTFSEFGRRVEQNGSWGTDHGTASPMFVVGERVRGGIHGTQPSLTDLDPNGNLKFGIPFHQVYATLADRWLGADSAALVGATYAPLDLFTGSPSGAPLTPGSPSGPSMPAPPPLPPLPSNRPVTYPQSYRIVNAAAGVSSFGGAPGLTSPAGQRGSGPAVAVASTPTQQGYWVATADGGVQAYGDAPFHGSLVGVRLNAPVVSFAATATGKGYWLLGRDGGVFSFGDAAFFGSTGGIRLNQPVVGMAAVPTGGGYWFVASDGGIFTFGPGAVFLGSTGAVKLNQPIVGMATTPTGLGYWMVASDGGIFAFGDAGFFGSTGGSRLNQPIVGMAGTTTGRGYRLVAADGGVFTFGDATFGGSAAGTGTSRAVGITT